MGDLLEMMQVPGDLVPDMMYIFIGALCVTGGLIGLIVLRLYLRSAVNRRVRSIKDAPAMSMMDIDTMRKRGLVSDQEYKAIRHSLAANEMDKERRRQAAERERVLMAQVEKDPEAARLLLDPLAGQPPPVAPARPAMAARAPMQAPQTAAPSRVAAIQPQAPAPQRVPAAAAPRAKESAPLSDLDVLLQKGAITPEEYARLKSFVK